ncbi:hypothetical protein D068_cds37170 [Bacillus atrophaeus UCMB-5137]|nr:hypothetical protein D068_cds37170 [Bacillus atrophaeus UCMB-5137]
MKCVEKGNFQIFHLITYERVIKLSNNSKCMTVWHKKT